jgi:hypothetical protein
LSRTMRQPGFRQETCRSRDRRSRISARGLGRAEANHERIFRNAGQHA